MNRFKITPKQTCESVTDLNMSDLVPPMDAEDAFETSYVKGLQSLDMATIWSP